MNSEPFDYDVIDPGIREVVRRLRERYGYETTDSGDGVTKDMANPENLPFPHVHVEVPRGHGEVGVRMCAAANRLFSTLTADELFPRGFKIQATYDPADRSGIISIYWGDLAAPPAHAVVNDAEN